MKTLRDFWNKANGVYDFVDKKDPFWWYEIVAVYTLNKIYDI